MKTQVLARDSLKNQKSQMITTVYDLILYVAMPIAFELSFVKIFQKSMIAYQVNDVLALSRLVVYFLVQFVLGVMVRKGYVNVTLKRLTLAVMILIQVKEAFFDEVLFDMILSMIMESGLMVLLFFKFSQMVIWLNMVAITWAIIESVHYATSNFIMRFDLLNIIPLVKGERTGMIRIQNCCMNGYWFKPCYH